MGGGSNCGTRKIDRRVLGRRYDCQKVIYHRQRQWDFGNLMVKWKVGLEIVALDVCRAEYTVDRLNKTLKARKLNLQSDRYRIAYINSRTKSRFSHSEQATKSYAIFQSERPAIFPTSGISSRNIECHVLPWSW